MLKARPKRARAPKKAPAKNRGSASACLKPTGLVCLDQTDSREFRKMLNRPAQEPNERVKAALSVYHRLIRK